MHEPIAPAPRKGRGVLIWAVTATLAAFVFGNVALLLFVKLRETNQQLARAAVKAQTQSRTSRPPANRSRVPPADPADSPFATLQDSDVVGRYKLFQEGVEVASYSFSRTTA